MKLVLKNFRGVREGEVRLEKLNILLGSNNSGKSSVLESLFLLPNPLRQVPYASPGSQEGMVAVEVLSYIHETLGSRAYISLFYNYGSDRVSISAIDYSMNVHVEFQRVNGLADVFVRDGKAYYVGSISVSSTNIMEYSGLGEVVYDPASNTYKRIGRVLNVKPRYFVSRIGEALYLHPLVVKMAWEYLKKHWVRLRGTGLLSVVARRVSESVGGDYDDVLLEPFMGGEYTVYIRTRDGRGIRLGDLGDGAQVYFTLMLLYEYIKPKTLLIDDIESHMNPYVLTHIASWLGKILDQGVRVVVTTHSLEATKIIANTLIDYRPQIILLSLRNGVLNSVNLSISEVEELEKKGLDVRVAEGILI